VTITDYPNIEAVVRNEAFMRQDVLPIKNRLRVTMCLYLHNGNIKLNIRAAKQDEIKKILTPAEQLEKMEKDNPAVGLLTQTLGLKL
jgi:DNA polymerase-3 subunit gamma/tau